MQKITKIYQNYTYFHIKYLKKGRIIEKSFTKWENRDKHYKSLGKTLQKRCKFWSTTTKVPIDIKVQ